MLINTLIDVQSQDFFYLMRNGVGDSNQRLNNTARKLMDNNIKQIEQSDMIYIGIICMGIALVIVFAGIFITPTLVAIRRLFMVEVSSMKNLQLPQIRLFYYAAYNRIIDFHKIELPEPETDAKIFNNFKYNILSGLFYKCIGLLVLIMVLFIGN